MRVIIAPAYLGFSAGQSKRSKLRGRTKKIWMTRNGLRLPVKEMTSYHIKKVIQKMRYGAYLEKQEALRNRDYFTYKSNLVQIMKSWNIPTFNALIVEGYKRGVIHSNTYPYYERELYGRERTGHEDSEGAKEKVQ